MEFKLGSDKNMIFFFVTMLIGSRTNIYLSIPAFEKYRKSKKCVEN